MARKCVFPVHQHVEPSNSLGLTPQTAIRCELGGRGSRILLAPDHNFRDRRLHDGWATPRTGVRVSFTLFVRQESMAEAGMGYAR